LAHPQAARRGRAATTIRTERTIVRTIFMAFTCVALTACNGATYLQTRRMADFHVDQRDFDAIAAETFRQIDAHGAIETIVAPPSLDPRARAALKRVHPLVAVAPGAAGTLPAGYFLVREFEVDEGEAHLEGQLGPVTGRTTAAGIADCGKEYSIAFAIEGGDWVNHAYKTSTCAQSRHWVPVDEPGVAR
jgi:hypothetical protein